MKTVEGKLQSTQGKYAMVVSRFNSMITGQLLEGAKDCLLRHGADEKDLTVYWVPGAFEIPQIVKKLVDSNQYSAVIALGAVIRGATPHFDQVVRAVTSGMADISLNSKVAIAFGVLTTDSIEQALERAGTKAGNKGWDAALAALEMQDLLGRIP